MMVGGNMERIAQGCLDRMYGSGSEFRPGQLDAIKSVVEGNKTLVVQRTGWGKSTVYFIATRILRDRGYGVTILISPLLSLMRNQIESAAKLGIVAETINSSNQDEWNLIKNKLSNDEIDVLLISPERLGNQEFTSEFVPLINRGVGLFVVDEAHCISDWGHDFRPDYQRIVNIINTLPSSVPVLATTATANNRVVDDIMNQLGDSLVILRGPLLRESLNLQVIELSSQAERMAWLVEHINEIDGSGIVYCSTKGDCNRVASWLRINGIDALEYHSSLSTDNDLNTKLRSDREAKLMNNEVKVIVSTIALGMGFDKPDLAYVIHYQRPGSIVAYYQQIGRAGRALDDAIVVLLTGEEDEEIQEYFIENAFPTPIEMREVIEVIERSFNGLGKNEILSKTNISNSRLDKCLSKLIVDSIISKSESKYFRTLNPWSLDEDKSNKITALRYQELSDMRDFVKTEKCYMNYIAEKLDDPYASECGKCSNCKGEDIVSTIVKTSTVGEAVSFLKFGKLTIEPRKQWPAGIVASTGKRILEEERNEVGRILSIYGDAGWGNIVRKGKYEDHYFSNELVDAAVDLFNSWDARENISWITFVPSVRRPALVKSFAQRLAEKLELPLKESIEKVVNAPEQKSFNNSFHQCKNAYDSFRVNDDVMHGDVLLVDDMFDSGWTFTVCGYRLKQSGVRNVYPFALASTATQGG
jgi:ATP-dependent DNA helicase RecQ